MKKCPFCAEGVQDEAIVCRFCGRDLQSGALPGQATQQVTVEGQREGCFLQTLNVGCVVAAVVVVGLVALLVVVGVIGSLVGNQTKSVGAPSTSPIDTSCAFIKNTLNASPTEVARILGKPDRKVEPSRDCDHLPSCSEATYQNQKYEVLYHENRLKWLSINVENSVITKNAIQYVGFPGWEPTLANALSTCWRSAANRGTATGPSIPTDGVLDISAFPASPSNHNQAYILIRVETNYDRRF